MINKAKAIITLLIISLILSSVVCKLSLNTSKAYLKTHSFFYDPVMTITSSIPLYKRMQKEAHLNQITSRINFAKLQFYANPKAPIYYIPVILFAPKLLITPWATLLGSGLMLLIFLYLLGYSLYLRNKNLLLSASVMSIFCAAPVLLDPFWGLSSGWFDMPAGFLFSAAIISFINWHNYRNNSWLLAFTVLVSCSVLARSIICIYAGLLFAPMMIYSTIIYYRDKKNVMKCFVEPIFITIILCGIMCGYYLMVHFDFIFVYYAKIVFSVTDSYIKSAGYFLNTFNIVGGLYVTFILIALILLGILYLVKKNKVYFPELVLYLWVILILPFFWVFILKSTGVYHVYLIEFSVLFVFFIHYNYDKIISRRVFNYINIVVILVSSVFIFTSYNKFIREANNPDELQRESKNLDITIANYIKELKPGQSWTAFFDEDYSRIPNCECFYRYGVYPDNYSNINYYLHKEYWNAFYPNKSSDEIADYICKNVDNLNLIIIYDNVDFIDKIQYGSDFSFAKNIAKKVATYMKTKENWENKKIYNTKAYSELAFYIKKQQ